MLEGTSNRKHPTKNNAAPMAAIFMASLINLKLPRGVPADGFDSKRTTAFIDLGKACKSSFQSAVPEPKRPQLAPLSLGALPRLQEARGWCCVVNRACAALAER